jgi:hypothetical protein
MELLDTRTRDGRRFNRRRFIRPAGSFDVRRLFRRLVGRVLAVGRHVRGGDWITGQG